MIVNTVEKTVQPQGENIGELLSALEDMFPNGQWAEYKIVTEKVIEYHYYPYQNFPIQPYQPYYEPWRITCGDTTTGTSHKFEIDPTQWCPLPRPI